MSSVKSMTGFGKSSLSNNYYKVDIEIKSVNNRYLDIFVKLPKQLNTIDENIRRLIKKRVYRGRVDVFIEFKKIENDDTDINFFDKKIIERYMKNLDKISTDLRIENNLELKDYIYLPDVIKEGKEDYDISIIEEILFDAVNKAIDELIKSRSIEGNELIEDIMDRLGILDEKIVIIENSLEYINKHIYSNYLEKINTLLGDLGIMADEQRICQEIAIISDKTDITEEIVRAKTHLDNFRKIIKNEEVVGRKLDFIIQEINREINTIGSKTSKIEISTTVIDFKSELEKIRQQLQNIE